MIPKLIPNHWYALIEASQLGKKPLGITRMGQKLVLWRDGDDRARAFVDRCPHRGVALSRGRVEGGALVCPYHGLEFEGGGACVKVPFSNNKKGKAASIPKGLDLKSLTITESHGLIWLWWGEAQADVEDLPPVPFPEDVPPWDDPAWAHLAMDWPQHVSRCVESNFDFYHAAFLHSRWVPTLTGLVNRTECQDLGGGRFSIEQHLDQGSRGDLVFKATFLPPSVSVICVGESMVGVVFDCPIDEDTTWRISRFIQTSIRIPGLRWLASWAGLQSDWGILQRYEDIPIARTMTPRYPEEGDHKLLGPDAGIARYRRWRRRALRSLESTEPSSSPESKATSAPLESMTTTPLESPCPAPASTNSPQRNSAPS